MSDAAWLTPQRIGIAAQILDSHRRAFAAPLLAGCGPERPRQQAAQELFAAPAVVVAHDGGADPRLIYANREALRLWRRSWDELVGLPSRLTAEPGQRQERAAALERARRWGAIEGYGGIRIDSHGRRFRIAGARLWCLRDAVGQPCGQAAGFESWWWL